MMIKTPKSWRDCYCAMANTPHSVLTIMLGLSGLLLVNLYYPVTGYSFGYNAKRWLQVYFVILMHITLLHHVVRATYTHYFSSLSPLVKRLLFILFVFSAFSCFIAPYALYSVGDWLHYALLLNTAFIIAAICRIMTWAHFVFLGALCTGFVWLLLVFFFWCLFTLALSSDVIDPWIVYPNVANIRFLNQVHVQLFFIIPVLLLILPDRFRLSLCFLGTVSVYMLIIAYGRGATLSLLLVFVLGYWASRKYQHQPLKRLLAVTGKMVICGFLCYAIIEIYYVIFNLENDYNFFRLHENTRYFMWMEIIKNSLQNPFGIGSYHYSGFTRYPFVFSHPHNFLLQFLIEWGIVPLITIVMLLYLMLVKINSSISTITDPMHLGLLLSLLAGISYSFFSGVLVMPASQVTFIVLFGVLLSQSHVFGVHAAVGGVENSQTSKVYGVSLTAALLMLIIGFYSVYAYRTYHLSLAHEALAGESLYEFKTTGPRMWLRGGIVVPITSD